MHRWSPQTLEAYRVLVEHATDAILISDVDSGLFIDANRAAVDQLGYTLRELTEVASADLVQLRPAERDLFGSEGVGHFDDVPILHRNGRRRHMDVWVKTYQVDDSACQLTIVRPRSRALGDANGADTPASSPEADALYRGLVDFIDVPVFVCDLTTDRVVAANPATRHMFGYSLGDLQSLSFSGLYPDAAADIVAELGRMLSDSGRGMAPDIVLTRKDGTSFSAHLTFNEYEVEGHKLIACMVRDITGQNQREQQLRDASERLATSEATYRGLVACTDDAVLISDYESALFVEANPAACALLGYSSAEWNQLRPEEIHPPDDSSTVRTIRRALRDEGSSHQVDLPMLRKDGTVFLTDLSQNVFEAAGRKLVVSIARDVTRRRRQAEKLERSYDDLKRAQAKALFAQKLAAVGEVAAGVAHEINNPAAFVSMNLQGMSAELNKSDDLMRRMREHAALGPDDAHNRGLRALLDEHELDLSGMRSMLDDNREGIERIRTVTRDLRLFSRVEHSEVIEVDLNAVVRSTLNLLMNELRHRGGVTVDLGDVPPFLAQRGKLAQVVTNLLLNASHAIEGGAADSNEITVRTLCEDNHVVLVVEDTGIGMSDRVVSRIFDPFFTTKPREQGTGLGLSLCSEIVSEHRGRISVESTPGEGSRFEVRIPVDTGLIARTPSPPPAVSLMPRLTRILVIDDDAFMLRAYRRMLVDLDAVIVASGAEALSILREDRRFDLILCDLMMPEMDGPQFYEAVVAAFPELIDIMVFCTGGAFTVRTREFVAKVDNPVLDKPVTLDTLKLFVRDT